MKAICLVLASRTALIGRPWRMVLAGLSVGVMAGVGAAGWDYPGQPPGPASMILDSSSLRASNRVLAASWRLAEGTPHRATLRDLQEGRSFTLTGEVFRIILSNGASHAASALKPDGAPRWIRLEPDRMAARSAARKPGQLVEVPLRSADGSLSVRWRCLLRDHTGYLREELDLTTSQTNLVVHEIVWFDDVLSGARTLGTVDGSPVVAGNGFLGAEDPNARNLAGSGALPTAAISGKPSVAPADSRVTCALRRDAPLRPGETLTVSFVWGVVPPGQRRRGFLHYLESERAHPYRPFLHYNSWYDTAWEPFALNETNCLEAIRLFGERLIRKHAATLDAFVFDDGWDNPRTLWKFHAGFPDGFQPLAELARRYDSRLGIWLSPFGGYGEPKDQRLRFGREQGFEINPTGFSLAGPRYYQAFRDACVGMIRRYGVNHFKFDGIAAGMYADGGAEYLLDTEAMRRLMLELRREDPHLFINLTTGSWPSPFWLRYADTLWRQGGDMGHVGKGSRQQQWLTYRDQEVFRNIVGKGPLFPLNALMTQGVAYSRQGMAGDPTFDSSGFRDDVRAFFGSGTSLQELYLQPGRLTDTDWTVLAEAARWARANADVLLDTHWIGGDPARLEIHGYAAWSPRQGVLRLRNPDDQPREFALDVGDAFELPPDAPRRYRLARPWADEADRPVLTATAGQPLTVRLEPFEVVVWDAVPAP